MVTAISPAQAYPLYDAKIANRDAMNLLILALETYLTAKESAPDFNSCFQAILLLFKALPEIVERPDCTQGIHDYLAARALMSGAIVENPCCLNDAISRVVAHKFDLSESRLKAIFLPALITQLADSHVSVKKEHGEPYWLRSQRIADLVLALGQKVSSPEDGVAKFVLLLRKLRAQIRLPRSISECLIDEAVYITAIPDLIEQIVSDLDRDCAPCLLNTEELALLLKGVYR